MNIIEPERDEIKIDNKLVKILSIKGYYITWDNELESFILNKGNGGNWQIENWNDLKHIVSIVVEEYPEIFNFKYNIGDYVTVIFQGKVINNCKISDRYYYINHNEYLIDFPDYGCTIISEFHILGIKEI